MTKDKKYSQYKSDAELASETEVIETRHMKTDYLIEPDGTFGMYIIRNEKTSSLPEVLKGKFMTRRDARQAIFDHTKDKKTLFSIREEDYNKKRIAAEERAKRAAIEKNRQNIDNQAITDFMIDQGIIVK